MKITMNELTVRFDRGRDDLIKEWRWLVGDTAEPILITSLGDAFLQDEDNSISWLDVGGGEYTRVAASPEEFRRIIPDNVDDWFVPQLVGDLLTSGLSIGENECFSFKKPPVFGGVYELENFEATDLTAHFSILGQIYFQAKDLPEGTPINQIKVEEP